MQVCYEMIESARALMFVKCFLLSIGTEAAPCFASDSRGQGTFVVISTCQGKAVFDRWQKEANDNPEQKKDNL